MKPIIVAEDIKYARNLIALYVKSFSGVKVDEVSNAKDLVEKVKKNKYSLIFTDNLMPPGRTGLDAIREIRRKDKKTPICMISCDGYARQKAIKVGANYSIDKNDSENLPYSLMNIVRENKDL
jgi:CheY-like chemotaxis protein